MAVGVGIGVGVDVGIGVGVDVVVSVSVGIGVGVGVGIGVAVMVGVAIIIQEVSAWTISPGSILRGRIIVEMLDVRLERVQAITEADAIAEGCLPKVDAEIAARVAGDTPARMEFWALWTSIYGVEW